MDALLVDDSPTMLLRLRRLLEQEHGVSVTALTSPGDALIKAQMQAFDLILVDHHMPEMDGTAFVQHLRAIPHYAQVPIVMITSDVCDAVRLAALEAGASDFLDKRAKGIELSVRLRNQIKLAAAVRRRSHLAGCVLQPDYCRSAWPRAGVLPPPLSRSPPARRWQGRRAGWHPAQERRPDGRRVCGGAHPYQNWTAHPGRECLGVDPARSRDRGSPP